MSDGEKPRFAVDRRQVLTGAAIAIASAGAATGVNQVVARRDPPPALVPFYGDHQAGVETPIQSHAAFCAHTLRRGVTREAAIRMLRLVTDDASRLTQAEPALNDQEPALATTPARLTITVGFGPGWFAALGLDDKLPDGFGDLPPYPIDRLQDRWSGGDLLLQVCADDPLVVSHAVRQLSKTVRHFAQPRWIQRGFSSAMRTVDDPTPRNLMGQIDGTVNPQIGSQDFSTVVWASNAGWFDGGTMLVLRRISMILDTWDELDVSGKELAVGRRLSDGAPLTGDQETDPADLQAVDSSGLPVIPKFSHIARAAPTRQHDRFLRRSFNYDDGFVAGKADVGLIFAAYQANLTRQYLPVQQRLAEQDLLNEWTVPIGSATFVIPPGCQPGGYLGEGLMS